MKKFIGFIGVLIGIISISSYFAYDYFYFTFYGELVKNIIEIFSLNIFLVIELIGLLISSFTFFKYKENLLGLLGIVLNLIPMIHYGILFLALG